MGGGLTPGSETEQCLDGGHGQPPPIVAKHELIEIDLELIAADAVIGTRGLESTNTADWDEAQRILRERLAARDNNYLDILRKGKQIVFNE